MEAESTRRLVRAMNASGLTRVANPRAEPKAWPLARGKFLFGSIGGRRTMFLPVSPGTKAIIAQGPGGPEGYLSSARVISDPEGSLVAMGAATPSSVGMKPAGDFVILSGPEGLSLDDQRLFGMGRRLALRQAKHERQQRSSSMMAATGDAVEYVGFEAVPSSSRYGLADLHSVVSDSLAHARAQWGWSAPLRIEFHRKGNAMGTSIGPGLDVDKPRRISISTRLLRSCSLTGVRRVVLHELCHHYREERWPRYLSGYDKEEHAVQSHDDLFCQALNEVDPAAGRPDHCRYFYDDVAS